MLGTRGALVRISLEHSAMVCLAKSYRADWQRQDRPDLVEPIVAPAAMAPSSIDLLPSGGASLALKGIVARRVDLLDVRDQAVAVAKEPVRQSFGAREHESDTAISNAPIPSQATIRRSFAAMKVLCVS
jgi:hypothetical protein